jgi:hypothetical protein
MEAPPRGDAAIEKGPRDMSDSNEERATVSPAARAFAGLSESEDPAERPASRARKAVVVTMALGVALAPTFWAAQATAGDAGGALATLNKSQAFSDGDDSDDNSGPGGGDGDDDSGTNTNTNTGTGGITDTRGGDTSGREDTSGTTAGTGASLTNQD